MSLFKNKISGSAALSSCVIFGIFLSFARLLLIKDNAVSDGESGIYYINVSASVNVFTVAAILGFVAAVVLAVLVSQNYGIGSRVNLTCRAVSLLSALAFAAVTALGTARSDISSPLTLIIAIAGLGCAAKFAFVGLGISSYRSKGFAITNLFLAAFYVARLLRDFMEQTDAPLSASGAYHVISLASLMMFFIYEGEAATGAKNTVLYNISGLVAAVFVPVYSIPAILLYITNGLGTASFMIFSVADIAAWLYVTVRLYISYSPNKIQAPKHLNEEICVVQNAEDQP